ncbi:MAG: DUF2993 domain-containing protein [Leptolyngbyaceae cyanobacterium bins.59]|nr:DUF2993 domain-containing protein [Leptolyngbyaceae cyanobacterium bins.59]
MSKPSQIISSILSPAVGLFLRSQVEQVENLQVKIEANDRQFFAGQIRRVFISADRAVYRGLHLSHLELVGDEIAINLRQVLRGQALRLLKPIGISGQVLLKEADLNHSLHSPLLAEAVTEWVIKLLGSHAASLGLNPRNPLKPLSMNLAGEQLIVTAQSETTDPPTPLMIQVGLKLLSPSELQLQNPQWVQAGSVPGIPLDSMTIDLGPETTLQTLRLEPEQLFCQGTITVVPAP